MTPNQASKAVSVLKRLEVLRIACGITVVLAMIAVVAAGTLAFLHEQDSWPPMQLPLFVACFLCFVFGRLSAAINRRRAIESS